MTARRHAAPAPPATGFRSRPAPTVRGHILRLLGAGGLVVVLLAGGVAAYVLIVLPSI